MCFFCFKQKTAYEMRISDWSSDGCSSDLGQAALLESMAGDSEIAERAVKVRIAADRCAKIVKTFLSMARQRPADRRPIPDRQRVASGRSVSVRVGLGGRRLLEQNSEPNFCNCNHPEQTASPTTSGQ